LHAAIWKERVEVAALLDGSSRHVIHMEVVKGTKVNNDWSSCTQSSRTDTGSSL
jgi:hypothetical protein